MLLDQIKEWPLALGRDNLDEAGEEIENLFNNLLQATREHFQENIILCLHLFKLAGYYAFTDQIGKDLSAGDSYMILILEFFLF